jgi:peptidoglycan/xylan/chitin deacetylase (PgdA/CDA1 family)
MQYLKLMLTGLKNKLNSFIRNKGLVLMYHRINISHNDPWQLSVSPKNFEQQLQVLKRFYNVIPLSQFLEQRQGQVFKKNTVCLTFDDGYADNYYEARPLLIKYDCPATFFISSELVDTNEWFWWDELALLILTSAKLPAQLTLRFPNEIFHYHIDHQELTGAERIQIRDWSYPQPPSSQRCALYLAIWERLQPLQLSEIQIVLQQIRDWLAYSPTLDKANSPMTSLQLESLFNCSLFSAGIHTASHPLMAHQSEETQKIEIQKCAAFLKPYSKGKSLPIAYPYGNYNAETLSIVAGMDISAGFTTSPSLVGAGSNAFTLGRFQAKDCGTAEFYAKLQTWFAGAIDPIKPFEPVL